MSFFAVGRCWLRLSLSIGAVSLFAVSARAELAWEKTRFEKTVSLSEGLVRTSFRFTNRGDKPATIRSVETSCGCTTATMAKKEYAPGESGEIEVIYDPVGQAGTQEKIITVTTAEAPDQPSQLFLRLEVPESVVVSPRLLTWSVGQPGQEKTVEIALNPAFDAKVTLSVPVDASFRARLIPGADSHHYKLVVEPTGTDATTDAKISLRFESPGQTHRPITVYARVL